MRPISSPTKDARSGFLLYEVMIALAVLAMLAAVVLPKLTNHTGPGRLKANAIEIAGLLRSDRVAAMQSGSPVLSAVDTRRGRLVSARGREFKVPKDVVMTLAFSDVERVPGVRFFPNGSSSGGRVLLAAGRTAYEVRVDWFTGTVAIEGPHVR